MFISVMFHVFGDRSPRSKTGAFHVLQPEAQYPNPRRVKTAKALPVALDSALAHLEQGGYLGDGQYPHELLLRRKQFFNRRAKFFGYLLLLFGRCREPSVDNAAQSDLVNVQFLGKIVLKTILFEND